MPSISQIIALLMMSFISSRALAQYELAIRQSGFLALLLRGVDQSLRSFISINTYFLNVEFLF
jgi:hypothetical protein